MKTSIYELTRCVTQLTLPTPPGSVEVHGNKLTIQMIVIRHAGMTPLSTRRGAQRTMYKLPLVFLTAD